MEFIDILRAVSKFVVIFFTNLYFHHFFFHLSVKSDIKWLSWVAYQFHIAVAKSRNNTHMEDCMDLVTFKNSFYFKVVRMNIYISKEEDLLIEYCFCFKPELADCLFNYLDTDKTGQLSSEKFLERLAFIVDANDSEKVEFLFKIFDHDGS
jgi:hypothetical protein